ncbi:MAG: hypothetical protein M9921_09465 [Fimbriimonadaceae bacterium]|nr:hypothetical protein [Chthonomonadaceae bacterium]MCO5297071.1 hypothetical protein [Fimbriimonadaceae bacterium]
MSKETTLARIDEEIRQGRLGVARDRLHGLVGSYPEDLALRKKLGDLYWSLGYPASAGQYWFLVPEPGEHAEEAFAAFLHSCQHDPRIVLKRLRLRGVAASSFEPMVRERVEAQKDRFRKTYGTEPPSDSIYQPRQRTVESGACCLFLALIVILAGIGFVQVLGWLR